MYPANFEYFRAESVEDALRLLGEHDDAKLMAGGHSLIPMMKLRLAMPEAVVDIGRIGALRGITKGDGSCRIGALTTHAEIAASDLLHCTPFLAEAARKIGDPAVRNKGTIGGNIAHADPASDLPAVLVVAGATIHLHGPGGERSVAAGDFFLGLLETDVREHEILTAIDVPCFGKGTGTAYLKHEHPASGYAVCGAAARLTLDGGKCTAAHLAFNGVSATPHVAATTCAALVGGDLSDDAIQAAADKITIDDPLSDVQASGEYRVSLARTYATRALRLARERA